MEKHEKILLALSLIEQMRGNLTNIQSSGQFLDETANCLTHLDTLQNLILGQPAQVSSETESIEETEPVDQTLEAQDIDAAAEKSPDLEKVSA